MKSGPCQAKLGRGSREFDRERAELGRDGRRVRPNSAQSPKFGRARAKAEAGQVRNEFAKETPTTHKTVAYVSALGNVLGASFAQGPSCGRRRRQRTARPSGSEGGVAPRTWKESTSQSSDVCGNREPDLAPQRHIPPMREDTHNLRPCKTLRARTHTTSPARCVAVAPNPQRFANHGPRLHINNSCGLHAKHLMASLRQYSVP